MERVIHRLTVNARILSRIANTLDALLTEVIALREALSKGPGA